MAEHSTYLLTADALDPASVTAPDVESAAAEYLTAALRSGALTGRMIPLAAPLPVTVVHDDKSRSTIWMTLDYEPVFYAVDAPALPRESYHQMRARA